MQVKIILIKVMIYKFFFRNFRSIKNVLFLCPGGLEKKIYFKKWAVDCTNWFQKENFKNMH